MSSAAGNGVVDPHSSGNGAGPYQSSAPAGSATMPMRPEVAVGAAFAGGFLLAVLLRKVRS
ncbi:MAG TPA: hypothetical protein VGF95_13750 [Solirubrobacteraceae bacterium]